MAGTFFDRYSEEFDRFYTGEKSRARSWVDRLFRASMARRFAMTMAELGPRVAARSVLDIGCGSGRYAVELARQGAAKLVGVDEAAAMLTLAGQLAREAGVQDRCRFVHASFRDFASQEPFDFAIGIGLFDYVFDPARFLAQVRGMVRSTFVASFPVRWHWLTPQRKLRYYLRNCPVRFYTEADVRRLLDEAGFRCRRLERISRDYLAVADVR